MLGGKVMTKTEREMAINEMVMFYMNEYDLSEEDAESLAMENLAFIDGGIEKEAPEYYEMFTYESSNRSVHDNVTKSLKELNKNGKND